MVTKYQFAFLFSAAVFVPPDPINHFAAIDRNSVLQVFSLQTKEEARLILSVNILLSSFKTSLKIFKHYKLKPSFSIIKDEKEKDKVGVGDKPPPPSFNNLIKFDPI